MPVDMNGFYGTVTAPDGAIWMIPGAADCVLRFDPSCPDDAIETFKAPVTREDHKWFGGALAADGCIYCSPGNSSKVLRIDTKKKELRLIGDELPAGTKKYHFPALGSDGRVYCAPASATRVLCIDPTTQSVEQIGPHLGSGIWKYGGGCLASDGCIYFPPDQTSKVLKVDTWTQDVSFVEGFFKKRGASTASPCKPTLAPNGRLYAPPLHAYRTLKTDPLHGTAAFCGPRHGGLTSMVKYSCQSALGENGKIYSPPCNAYRILEIDPETEDSRAVGPVLGGRLSLGKYEGATLAADGCVYCAPGNATDILVIDTTNGGEQYSATDVDGFWRRRVKTALNVLESASMASIGKKDATARVDIGGLLLLIPNLLWHLVSLQSQDSSALTDDNLVRIFRTPGVRSKLLIDFPPAAVGEDAVRSWLLDGITSGSKSVLAYLEALSGGLELLEEAQVEGAGEDESKDASASSGAPAIAWLARLTEMHVPSDLGIGIVRSSPDTRIVPASPPRVRRAATSLLGRARTLLSAILDNDKRAIRERLFSLRIVQRVMADEHSVDMWLVYRLGDGERAAERAIEYFEHLSATKGLAPEEWGAIERKIAGLGGLLPATLSLTSKQSERLVKTRLLIAVLDIKLTQPRALLALITDGVVLSTVLIGALPFFAGVLGHDESLTPSDLAILGVIATGLGFLLVREIAQVWSMVKLGREKGIEQLSVWGWASDVWNIVDGLVIATAGVACWMATLPERNEGWFPIVAAVACGLLWLKLLGYVKVLNQKFATYVLCLFQIAADIRSFLVILLLVMCAFGNMFYLVNAAPVVHSERFRSLRRDDDEGHHTQSHTGAAGPFWSVEETLVSVYRMMIGDFERDWFSSMFMLLLFLGYTFIVMILMLNILIAVVSDSYDYAVIKSRQLFCRARLELAAELDVMFSGSCQGGSRYSPLGEGAPPNGLVSLGESILSRVSESIKMSRPLDADDENDAADDWLGRALDMERRTKKLVDASEARLAAKLEKIEMMLPER